MKYDTIIMGKIIKELRKKQGLTQEVLSGLAGIGRTHLTMIENGTKTANIETLWRIADALNMNLSSLIAMVEKEILQFSEQ